MKNILHKRFIPAYKKIKDLQNQDRYIGAFIFGSLARKDSTDNSDFDVKVIVNKDNPCKNINHPIINGVKLDITFISIKQLHIFTEQEIKNAERIPLIAESFIIFDKTGELTKLQKHTKKIKPPKYTQKDFQLVQFMIYHADDKAKRYLEEDEMAALFVMNTNLSDILKYHYKLKGKWWVSNKRLLQDLRSWDKKLAHLVEAFVGENKTKKKYAIWTRIIDYILESMGGKQPISENNCSCNICKKDLSTLLYQKLRS